MIDPIALGLTKEYVSKHDKENPTIWLIGALDSMEKAQLVASFGKIEIDEKDEVKMVQNSASLAQNNFNIVKYGLKGFRNFQINGVELEFKTEKEKFMDIDRDVVSRETLRQIPLFIINELANAIWGENQVNSETIKN